LGVLAPFDEPVVPEVEPEVSPENLLPKSQGAFMSALNYIGRFGQVGKNLAMLDFEGAARQGADILGDTVDSVLPGDWIPEASRAQDYKTGSDVMGISKEWQEEHPLLNIAASLPLDLILDPLTFTGLGVAGQIGKTAAKTAQAANAGRKALSFGISAKRAVEIPGSARALESTGKALSAGFKKIPGHEEFAAGAGKLWHGVKRATGNLTPDREVADLVAKAGAKGSTTAQAATGYGASELGQVAEDIQLKTLLLLNDVAGEAGNAKVLGVRPGTVSFGTRAEQLDLIDRRLAKLPWDDGTKASVREEAIKNSDFYRQQWEQGVGDTTFSQPEMWQNSAGRPVEQTLVKGLHGEEVARVARNKKIAGTAVKNLDAKAARYQAKVQELEPLYNTSANEALAASTRAEELFDLLPNLNAQKKAMDALDAKITRWQGATDALGGMMNSSQLRNGQLVAKFTAARATVAKAAEAFAVYKKAAASAAAPEVLEPLRQAAKEAAQGAGWSQGDLFDVAKAGEFGFLEETYKVWQAARQESSVARAAFNQARKEGVDAVEAKRLLKEYQVKKELADAARRSLKTLRPRLSESNLYDNKIAGRLATKQGKLRELRIMMQQFEDPDIARLGQMTKTAYKQSGIESAATAGASRAFNRLNRAKDKLADIGDRKSTIESSMANLADAPGLEQFAASQGYKYGTLPKEMAPLDFTPRTWTKEELAALAAQGSKLGDNASLPDLLKSRTLDTPEKFADYYNDLSNVLESDLASMAGRYGEQLGRAARTAYLGKALVPAFKALSDPGSRSALNGVVDAMRQAGKHDNADVLEVAIHGLPPREGIFTILAIANRYFKQGATGGVFVPKPAFTLRNLISSPIQTLANPEARAAAWQMVKNIPRDFIESFQDGFRALGIPKMGESRFAPIQAAIKASGGSREKMLAAITDPEMRLAVEHGVLDSGFISTEQMQAAVAKAGNIKDWSNWKDWPSDVVKGSEQRMRFGLFRKLLAEGHDASNAARITTDSLYDYAYASSLNRALRDIIPFGQFMFKAIPQQAKFLAEQPAVAVGLESLVGERNNKDQVFPYQEGRVNIPLGKDNEGDPVFASGLGLPVEALNALPNPSANPLEFGRQIGRNVVGASQPLLKSALSIAFGVDPYFGNSYGSYSRLPGNIEGGKLGSAYNMAAGTGLATPITEPLRLIGKVADDRQTPGQKALDLLTGMNVSSVNQDKALQQRLTEYLRRNPDASSMEILHAKSNDPKTVQLIKELNAAKARIKERRKAKDP